MKKLELYQCEICNTQFNDPVKARECEASHVKIAGVISKKYRAREEYPNRIIVSFENGEELSYER